MTEEEVLQQMNYYRNLAVSFRTLGLDVNQEDSHVIENIIEVFKTKNGNPTIDELAKAIDDVKLEHAKMTETYYSLQNNTKEGLED